MSSCLALTLFQHTHIKAPAAVSALSGGAAAAAASEVELWLEQGLEMSCAVLCGRLEMQLW
eukprot:3103083-Amphidinium_carterae.2